mmetsp:Transcript_69359/g.166294  ORF Transcript_69359/g.166294 Transcript_69359/m.166294 type:complete len:937 (-) Transcript_69359:106-2916(-)
MERTLKEGCLVQSAEEDLLQLQSYDAETSTWTAVTIPDGKLCKVDAESLALVDADGLHGWDVVIGPRTSPDLCAAQVANSLADRGYAHYHTIFPTELRQSLLGVANELERSHRFDVLPVAFEEGLLGRGIGGKVCEFEATAIWNPQGSPKSPEAKFQKLGENFAVLSDALGDHLKRKLGVSIGTLSNLLLRRSFRDVREMGMLLPRVPEAIEVEAFLDRMHRSHITLLQALGPSESQVTLFPRTDGEMHSLLRMLPGDTVCFMSHEFDFELSPGSPDDLVLQMWFMEPKPEIQITQLSGNMELLEAVPAGARPPIGEPISIVGMGLRLPGCNDQPENAWQVYRNTACDGMLKIPMTRYDIDQYCLLNVDPAVCMMQGKGYFQHQGHLEGLELFDHKFFQVPVTEAEGMDPEQRFTLEQGWKALADAGVSREETFRTSHHIGVFVGQNQADWTMVPPSETWRGPTGCGSTEAVTAGRFSFVFNLKGPTQMINTACSSSLVSTHSAKCHLLFKHDPLEGAVSVGVSLNLTPHVFLGNCSTGALSVQGRSFSFDKAADGFGRAEGCSAIFMKPLPYDPDAAYAVLAGSQTGSDGRSASLTAPNGPAQSRCIKSVLDEMKLSSPEIDCFECHGTGTALGDPIEMGAFKRLYARDKRTCPVMASTSKSNIGHCEAGAGLAGFTKCVEMVMHAEACPNIHLREMNPNMDVEGFPVRMLTEGVWLPSDASYVGVSSFGVSGTNGHCMAYGTNVLSTRGRRLQNTEWVMRRKVREAAPRILQLGESWRDWEVLGRPSPVHNVEAQYQVLLDQKGTAMWHEVEDPPIHPSAGPFLLQGSFNDWGMDELFASSTVEGLFVGEILLGDAGEEVFQIIADYDPDKVFFPDCDRCTGKLSKILGPCPSPSQERAWLVRGTAGTCYTVELFLSEAFSSVSWYPSARGCTL